MKPIYGKRSWVKLWTTEWLDGTTRYTMTDAQRAFWIDLLAMAGRSRVPGIICAGLDGDSLVGYPLNRFSSLMAGPEQIDIEATLRLFERTDKVKLNITSEGPPKLFAIELLNWKKYQSDLDAQADRSRNYRKRKRQRHASVTENVTAASRSVTEVEVEGERDSETEVDKRRRTAATAFESFHCEPFGEKRFQTIWIEEWQNPAGGFADAMERTIQRCQSLKIKVPGRFFAHKREIEKVEAENSYKRSPL